MTPERKPMDRLELLDAKVKQMIDLVQVLRDENQALKEQLADVEARSREAAEERQALDRERDQVRDRIEQLLGDLEGLEGARGEGAPGGAEGSGGSESRDENPVLPGLG
jgi:FtsZ-binding cell division protein ZapB